METLLGTLFVALLGALLRGAICEGALGTRLVALRVLIYRERYSETLLCRAAWSAIRERYLGSASGVRGTTSRSGAFLSFTRST